MQRTLICAGLLLTLGCAQPQPKTTTNPPAFRALGEKVTIDPTWTDESIGFEVRKRLTLVGPADLAAVIIQIDDGTVTLSGSAPNRQAAWRAESAARSVPGVKNVVNEIQPATPGAKF